MKKILLLLMLCFSTACINNIQAQTKEELQKREGDLRREITELTNSLTQIQKNKKMSVAQVASVQRKIAAREELIGTINKQVRLLDENIYQNEVEIYRLKKELDTLKLKYSQSIVFAYKNRSNYQYLNFLFSASNFNDAIKRMTYLKSYRQLRETQAGTIVKTQSFLLQKVNSLNASKTEQGQVLLAQKGQLIDIEQDKKQKDQVVKELKGQEKEVSAQIRKKESQRQQMKSTIFAIIKREEAEAARRAKIARDKEIADEKRRLVAEKANKAKTPDATVKNNSTTTPTKPKSSEPSTGMTNMGNNSNREYSKLEGTAEGLEMSINFEKGRGRLPWPVSIGSVVIPFGNYGAGGKLIGVSDGIEIALPEGSAVKAVADGKVSYVGDVGGEQVVIVKHGKYFTSYSHLAGTNVSRDQEVKAGTLLGTSGTGSDGDGALLFMVTNDKGIPLNPKNWLKSR